MMRYRSTLAAALLLLAAASAAHAAGATPKADKAAIRAHLAFLADDLLEGRDTGSRGYDIAANYVAAQFAQYGLAPKGSKGSYLQSVPLRASRAVAGSGVVELSSAAGVERLSADTDFVIGADVLEPRAAAAAPLVFVGYGIRADRFNHNDYAGIDVKGKIVVVLQGKPTRFPTEEGAHFGSGREKRKLAAQLGAVGIVTLWTPDTEKAMPFAKVLERNAFPSMSWLDSAGKPAHSLPALQDDVALSLAASKKLFTQVDARLDDIYALAAANKPVPQMDLKMSMLLSHKRVLSEVRSSNVVGMIEGSDPRLKNEYVVFSAHLDHIGQVKEKTGDNIYNGAMDNASGVATLIETARLFSQSATRPRRSVLFVALTGEEKGLLGSDYFATNPTVPAGAMVANVNLDMPLLTFDFKNVVAFGAEHSSMKGSVQRAAAKMGLGLIADPWPAQGLFTRSDHYMFVRQGVPSIFLVPGQNSFNKNEDGAKLWATFLATHYHQPSDDLRLPFNFDAAARFAQLNYNIALEIANASAKPTWNQGDFFGDTFKK
ncbi:M28 family metallopeptidase [Massilia sp. TWR1-2-2]|uniref:M28 family metallopeptidase n=1 Tax=Massilia sp. TWR1-2-2 TaxID=2804584 RepID=UPI003CECDCE5